MPASSSPPKNIKRKTSLFDLVLDNEPISVDALAELAGISCSTLRRELRGLVADGLANLNAGQVTIALAAKTEMPFAYRAAMHHEEKEAIARAALELIKNGETIFITGGTTTLELARLLPGSRRVTVITNALPVANLLVEDRNIKVVVLGGEIRPGELTMHGHLVLYGIEQVRADKLFYGTEAISAEYGLSHSQLLEVNTDRALIKAFNQTIILADHSKVGKVASASVVPISEVDIIITGNQLPPEQVAEFRRRNVQLILA